MASNLEIYPVLNAFIDSNVTYMQLENNLEDARSTNIEQIQKDFHLNAEGNPWSNMPDAISDCEMEVDLDLPLRNTSAIYFPSCTLYPPHPDEIVKVERNPGYKSVFMACIVKNISEEIMREILGYCGKIECMKIMKNNCIVKFFDMEAADRATYLSNFGIKIENKDDVENNGRIFIYYSSDEVFVNQGKEIRHREKEFSNLSTFVPNSEQRALIDKLKNEETFIEATGELIALLDCGKCDVMTFDYFFQIIMSIQVHAERLINVKRMAEEELKAAEAKFNTNMEGILLQLTPLIKFLNLIKFSNHCLNSLTSTKKKEIMRMNKLALSVLKTHFTEAFKKQNEDLDISENQSSSENSAYSSDFQETVTEEEVEKLKEEVKAYREKLRIASEENAAAVKLLEEKQRHYLALEAHYSERNKKKSQELKDIVAKRREYEESQKRNLENEVKTSLEKEPSSDPEHFSVDISEFDMQVICLIAAYFKVHPHGVGIDRIHYYVSRVIPEIKISKIKMLMLSFPNMFQMDTSGTKEVEHWYFINYPVKIPIN